MSEYTDLPEMREPAIGLEALATGGPLRFAVEGKPYQLRQPTPEELAEAQNVQRTARLLRSFDPEIAALAAHRATPEQNAGIEALKDLYERVLHSDQAAKHMTAEQRRYLDERINGLYDVLATQTAADPLLNAYSAERRDLWMARKLLQDDGGKALDFDAQSFAVQAAAQRAAADLVQEFGIVPFGWVILLAGLLHSTDT